MENLIYVDRRNTNCNKWDGQTKMFGEEGLHAMWVADMDFKAPKCVIEALHSYVESGVYGYMKIPNSYYQSFINWEKEQHHVTVEKEWICFSPGVVSAFNWAIQFMTQPGEAVIVTTPVYYPFLDAVKNNERKLIMSDLINENGVYSIDFEDFEKKIIENEVKAFILCSPHNPAGRVWTKEELEKTFEICEKHDVFVISDEIHQDLIIGERKHCSSLLVAKKMNRMMSIMAPSKTFNLAGAQNSLVVIPDESVRAKWDKFITGIRVLGGNAFGYVAAEAAFTGGHDWLLSIRRQVKENFEYVSETLKKELPDAVVTPLEGTYLMWIDLKACVKAEDLRNIMQKKCKLAVDYGDWFGGERFGTFIRMNLATSMENVKIGVDKLVQNLK